jgi:hypothetical protein
VISKQICANCPSEENHELRLRDCVVSALQWQHTDAKINSDEKNANSTAKFPDAVTAFRYLHAEFLIILCSILPGNGKIQNQRISSPVIQIFK